jgi:hypothetical protein
MFYARYIDKKREHDFPTNDPALIPLLKSEDFFEGQVRTSLYALLPARHCRQISTRLKHGAFTAATWIISDAASLFPKRLRDFCIHFTKKLRS